MPPSSQIAHHGAIAQAALALPFLGKFDVPRPISTLLLSGESGGATIRETLARVARSKGVEHWNEEMLGFFHVGFELPSLDDPQHVAALAEHIRTKGIQIVIIDPLYLCLVKAAGGSKVDTKNLFEMGPLLSSVAKACLDAGATPIMVHHFRSGGVEVGDKPDLELLAYAGIKEYARQWVSVHGQPLARPGEIVTIAGHGPSDEHTRTPLDLHDA